MVSAKAEVGDHKVSLGTQLEGPLAVLKAELATGLGVYSSGSAPLKNRITVGTRNESSGAKFIKN